MKRDFFHLKLVQNLDLIFIFRKIFKSLQTYLKFYAQCVFLNKNDEYLLNGTQ